MNALLKNDKRMMVSLEISKMTGKPHKNTTRLIRSLINKELIHSAQFELSEYKDSTGRKLPMYKLDKTASILVVAQQSPEFTAKMIERWQELEEIVKISGNNSRQPSKSYDDFLRDLMETCKDDPEMIKSQAHLGSKALSNARRAKKWYREQFLPHFRFVLGITEHGDTPMMGYTNNPQTLEQVSYKFTKQWPDLLYLSCSNQNDLFSAKLTK